MKLADTILIVASIISFAWASFLVSMIPLGVADQIFQPIREALQVAHTDEQAKSFAGRMGGIAGRNFETAAWLAVGPIVAVNGSWCILAGYRIRRRAAELAGG